MKFKLLVFFVTCSILFVSTFFISCKDDTIVDPPTGNNDPNTLQGYVKSANGSVAIPNATVRIVTASDLDTTVQTNINGLYKVSNVPNGSYRIIYTKGSFIDSIDVTIPIQGNVPDANLLPVKRLAYYWGEFDNIQSIVRNMGYASYLDTLVLADFSNITKLNSYSIIFINCGVSSKEDLATSEISNNLNSFLNNGGKIYASDWAFGCVKGIHPELEGTYDGDAADSVNSTVVHTGLESALGKNNVKINYNLSSWLSLDPANNTTVNVPFLRATYQAGGFTVNNNVIAFYRNEGGTGKLLYTTFHEEAQVTGDMTKILQYFVFEL